MSRIIPAILARSKKEFNEQFNKLLPITQNLQIDLMDGKFVKQKSIYLNKIPDLKKYNKEFEAHLMVKNPIALVSTLKQKGFRKIIFHYESYKKEKMIEKTIALIRENNMDVWLALNPETETEKISPYLDKIDGVLIMGVYPGKSGQEFIPETLKKIKKLRKKSRIKIQIDGGVNEKTAPLLFKAGADYLNSGSFVSNAKSPGDAINQLEKAFNL